MSLLDAIIQGLIQGLTEFLPVSSSGHLSIFQYFTGLSSEQSSMFAVLLHLGTLLAVVAAFYKLIWELILEFLAIIRDIFTRRFTISTNNPHRRMIFMLLISLIPLAFAVVLKDVVAGIMEDNDIVVEGIAFLCTSALLFFAGQASGGKTTAADMSPKSAITIGLAQCVATVPGISRSGSTICSGLLCGLDRSYAVSYSFILGVPAVLGAGLLELLDLSSGQMSIDPTVAIAGVLVAAVSGFCAIRLVQLLVKNGGLRIFSVYTLILGVAVLGIGIYEHISGGAVRAAILAMM